MHGKRSALRVGRGEEPELACVAQPLVGGGAEGLGDGLGDGAELPLQVVLVVERRPAARLREATRDSPHVEGDPVRRVARGEDLQVEVDDVPAR